MSDMPKVSFESLEGSLIVRELGDQVCLEMDGDCWYGSMNFTAAAVEGLYEWLTCYRISRNSKEPK